MRKYVPQANISSSIINGARKLYSSATLYYQNKMQETGEK